MRTEEKEQWRSESVHKMLMVLLPYLHSLFELLSLSRVSPALRNAIRDQTVLWTKVVVDPPLSSRLTDDILWDFTSRSAGKLNTLILRKCSRVTSKGLWRVVDANPLIKKVTWPSRNQGLFWRNDFFFLSFSVNCDGMHGVGSRRNHCMCWKFG